MKNNEVNFKNYSFKNTEDNLKDLDRTQDTPQRLRINQKLALIKQTLGGGRAAAGAAAGDVASAPKK
jgi:hypothetical protein